MTEPPETPPPATRTISKEDFFDCAAMVFWSEDEAYRAPLNATERFVLFMRGVPPHLLPHVGPKALMVLCPKHKQRPNRYPIVIITARDRTEAERFLKLTPQMVEQLIAAIETAIEKAVTETSKAVQ